MHAMITKSEVCQLRQRMIPGTYTRRHDGTLLVVGSAEGALDELARARTMRKNAMIATVGHAAGLTKADFVVSDHYEVHAVLRVLQERFGRDHFTTHCTLCSQPYDYPEIDHWWGWSRAAATSMETAVRIGLTVGFMEVILCGCPLETGLIQHPDQVAKDGVIWPPGRDVKIKSQCYRHDSSQEVLRLFREAFKRLVPKWKGKVFSMSGYTKQQLGEPSITDPQTIIARDLWKGGLGASMAYPVRMGRWPDADAVDILRRLCQGTVCDVGCGTGRCSDAFSPSDYVGIDVNPTAVRQARAEKPGYTFKAIGYGDSYPDADTYLFYTVLLHVPDCELAGVLSLANRQEGKPSRIVIFESMSRELRRERHGAFNRDESEYRAALESIGRKVVSVENLPSEHYPGVRTFMVAE